jgi:hypothetical protein
MGHPKHSGWFNRISDAKGWGTRQLELSSLRRGNGCLLVMGKLDDH